MNKPYKLQEDVQLADNGYIIRITVTTREGDCLGERTRFLRYVAGPDDLEHVLSIARKKAYEGISDD